MTDPPNTGEIRIRTEQIRTPVSKKNTLLSLPTPHWSSDIWNLILKGEVAIGMTKEMLDVTCHPVVELGHQISGNATSAIQACGGTGRKFLFRDGKVTQYFQ